MFNSKAVSAAKAVAILLMVVGHAGCPRYINDYLGMFHMPLFFVMSGYCFKAKYLDDAVTFVRRRITGIWWPYVKWGLFFLILHNVFVHLNIYNDVYGSGGNVSHLYTWNEFMIKGLGLIRMSCSEQLLDGFWFLKELFWASLIGYLCIRYLKRFSIAAALMIMLMMVFKYTDPNIIVPILGLAAKTWMATFFFLFGHAWRENEEKGGITSRFDSLSMSRQIGIVVLLAAAVYVIEKIIGPTDMLHFTFGSALPYVVGALCGTMMVAYVCRWIVKAADSKVTAFLTFTGRHTFEVLTWHFLCFKLVSLVIIAVYGLQIERLATFPVIKTADLRTDGVDIAWSLWWIAYFVVGAGIPLLWQYIRFKFVKENRRY